MPQLTMQASNKKTEILISTYNGEKYIKEQLDSILMLDGLERIKISVRDDGSTDGTIKILKDYKKKFNINLTLGKNVGLNNSMIELLKNADADSDYFAFSDQDDIWSPKKITLAVEKLSIESDNIPLLWGCREELVKANLDYIALMPIPPYLGNFYVAIIQNSLAGHTQVFNKTLRDLLLKVPEKNMYLYDWMAYIIATAMGKVFFEEKICGKYRQHGKNVVGYELNPIRQIFRRFKRLKTGAFKKISAQTYGFYLIFKNDLETPKLLELEKFLKSRKSFHKRLIYSFTSKISRRTRFETLQFRLLYVFGVYGTEEVDGFDK